MFKKKMVHMGMTYNLKIVINFPQCFNLNSHNSNCGCKIFELKNITCWNVSGTAVTLSACFCTWYGSLSAISVRSCGYASKTSLA
jgi:hypothetical protein